MQTRLLILVLVAACEYRVELPAPSPRTDTSVADTGVTDIGVVDSGADVPLAPRDAASDIAANDGGNSNCFTDPQRFCALGQICDTPPAPSARRVGSCAAAIPELEPTRFAATIAIEDANGVSRVLSSVSGSSALHDYDRSPDGPVLPLCTPTAQVYGLRVIGEPTARFGACQHNIAGLLASTENAPAFLLETSPIGWVSAEGRFPFRDAAPDCSLSAGWARLRIRVEGRWYTMTTGYIDVTPSTPNANGPVFRASFQGTVTVGSSVIIITGRFYTTASVYLC